MKGCLNKIFTGNCLACLKTFTYGCFDYKRSLIPAIFVYNNTPNIKVTIGELYQQQQHSSSLVTSVPSSVLPAQSQEDIHCKHWILAEDGSTWTPADHSSAVMLCTFSATGINHDQDSKMWICMRSILDSNLILGD